jgi:SNF2 family DNA or RNA helicase
MFLREITNGFAYETIVSNPEDDIENWKTSKLPHRINTNKIDEMRKVFMTRDFNSAIIYTFFDEDNRMVAELMEELGLSYRSVLKMDPKKRNQIIKDFKSGVFDYLIIKPSSGGVGLNLERPQTLHWYSIPHAWTDLKQRRGRIHRRGQTKPQQEYFYFGSLLDKDMYRNVAIKKRKYNDDTFNHFVDMSKKKLKC